MTHIDFIESLILNDNIVDLEEYIANLEESDNPNHYLLMKNCLAFMKDYAKLIDES